MSHPNAFRDGYTALAAMFNASADFAALFPGLRFTTLNPSGNSWDNRNAQFKGDDDINTGNPADYPRARLEFAGIPKPSLECASNASQLEVEYLLEVQTGAVQQGVAMDCAFTIIRAMLPWRQYIQSVVMWKGKACVMDVDAQVQFTKQAEIGETESRGFKQWLGTVKIKLAFVFETADL